MLYNVAFVLAGLLMVAAVGLGGATDAGRKPVDPPRRDGAARPG